MRTTNYNYGSDLIGPFPTKGRGSKRQIVRDYDDDQCVK